MNKKRFRVVLMILISIGFYCCEKETLDFREAYTGEWEFNVSRFQWDMMDEYNPLIDTLNYIGGIDFGSTDSTIFVNYLEGSNIELKIQDDGDLSLIDNYLSGTAAFIGMDSIRIYYRTRALGSGVKKTIIGKKI